LEKRGKTLLPRMGVSADAGVVLLFHYRQPSHHLGKGRMRSNAFNGSNINEHQFTCVI